MRNIDIGSDTARLGIALVSGIFQFDAFSGFYLVNSRSYD